MSSEFIEQEQSVPSISAPKAKFMGITMGYVLLGLVVTFVVGFFFALLLQTLLVSDPQTAGAVYLGSLVVSAIGTLILTFVIQRKALSHGSSPLPLFLAYAALDGVLVGAIFLMAGGDYLLIAKSLGLTLVPFLAMFMIGYFTKANLAPLGIVGLGLLVGALVLSAFYGLWFLISPSTFLIMDLIVSVCVLVGVILVVGYDAFRMRKIVESGVASTNLALFCAFSLYVDFISIFVRVFYLLLRNSRN